MDLRSLNKYVISLPHRTDRLSLVQKELEGWDYTVIPGVLKDNPVHGIAQAHLNCIQQPGHVLIMEDDIVLRNGAENHFNQALQHAPEGWDILLGGVYETKGLAPVNEYWDQLKGFCGLHFYLVNEKAKEKILNYDFNSNQHIDRWIGKNFNCYVLKKYIATQRSGFSDNVKKEADYSHLIKKSQLL